VRPKWQEADRLRRYGYSYVVSLLGGRTCIALSHHTYQQPFTHADVQLRLTAVKLSDNDHPIQCIRRAIARRSRGYGTNTALIDDHENIFLRAYIPRNRTADH
jgi:hypothetical protein